MSRSARVAGAMALWLGALIVGLYFTSNNDTADPEGPAPGLAAATTEVVAATTTTVPSTTTEAVPSTTTSTTTTTTTEPATTTTTTGSPEAVGASIEATLANGRFSVSGVVPDEALAEQILGSVAIVYGPDVASSIVVDPEVDAEEWLPGVPRAVGLLPIIGEGTIEADATGVHVSGRSPNADALGVFESGLTAALGVAPDTSQIEITNLGFPSFNARRTGGELVLSGVLAHESVKTAIVETAKGIYGESAVDDQITIGDGLDVPYWSYTMPGVLQLFAQFPDYEIDIANGITAGSLNDGANFEIDSAELSPATEAILPIALGIMTRDPSLGMEVAGHTDSLGDPSYNQQLSEARAQAAADWLIAAGIDAARIRVVGFGETQPIASNETSAGRASNRRVEFVFGPASVVLGG